MQKKRERTHLILKPLTMACVDNEGGRGDRRSGGER